MRALGHVLLEVNPHEAHGFSGGRDVLLRVFGIRQIIERDAASETNRHVVLRDLVVLRHVRVKVVFPVKLTDLRDFAVEHQSGQRGEAERLLVHGGHRPGIAEAHRAGVLVRAGSILDWTAAEHLAAGFELDVNLETDGGYVARCHGKSNADTERNPAPWLEGKLSGRGALFPPARAAWAAPAHSVRAPDQSPCPRPACRWW